MGNYGSLDSETNAKDVDMSPRRKFFHRVNTEGNMGKYNFDVSKKLEVLDGENSFQNIEIPSEIIHEILLYLDLGDLYRIFQTCKFFHLITHTQYFWKRRFQIFFSKSFEDAEKVVRDDESSFISWKRLFFIQWCRQNGDEGCKNKFHVVPRPPENSGPYRIDPGKGDEAKIVFLGESSVGKTSLVFRFIENKFDEYNMCCTIGMEFRTKRLMNIEMARTIRLDLWDQAGEERYRSLSQTFYRGSHGAICVFSIDSHHSFQLAKKWVKEYKDYMRNNKPSSRNILLVGNKSDLEEKREVMGEEAKEFARVEKILGYVETSAKEGKNVWVAMCLLAENIMKTDVRFQEDHFLEGDDDDKTDFVLERPTNDDSLCFVM